MKEAKCDHFKSISKSNDLRKIPKNLINVLNIHVLDFDQKKEHTLYLNQIKSKNKKVYFKSPLKIRIKKDGDLFYLFEDILHIEVSHKSFQKSLELFQKEFYTAYLAHKKHNINSGVFEELSALT